MTKILTLTLNPSIDGSCDADRVRPTHKIRTRRERYDPGGGGINVARVIDRLGGEVEAHYLAGGPSGMVLESLLEAIPLRQQRIMIADQTRTSLSVHELETGCEYRFVPEGPLVSESEWRGCLDHLAKQSCDWLIASGSLPRGVPDDFYVRVGEIARRIGAHFVLDTSGAELKAAVKAGGISIVKPSLGEFEQLVGRSLPSRAEQAEAARNLIGEGLVETLVVSLGHVGALMASSEGVVYLPALKVEARSAVGAGDSFVAAFSFAMSRNLSRAEAFRLAVAAGSAAVLTPGTDLCHKEDVERLLPDVPEPLPAGTEASPAC